MLDEQRDDQSNQAEKSADEPLERGGRENVDEAKGADSKEVETRSAASEDALTTGGPANTGFLGTEVQPAHNDDSRGDSDDGD